VGLRILKVVAVVAALVVVLVATVGLGFAFNAYLDYRRSRVWVTLYHDGPKDLAITDVEVSGREDRVFVEQLRFGEHRDVVLKLKGESDLPLHFKAGDLQCSWNGGYVEGGYSLTFEIHGCAAVSVVDTSLLSLW
jgi:hypothetical protein